MLTAALGRAENRELVDRALGHRRERAAPVAGVPLGIHRGQRLTATEPLVEAPIHGNVQVGGHRAAELLARARIGGGAHGDPADDRIGGGILAHFVGLVADDRGHAAHVLGRQPVGDDAVGDAHGLPHHAFLQRRDVDRHARGRRPAELEPRHAQRLALHGHRLAVERLAHRGYHLGDARERPLEAAAVPALDGDVAARADAEHEASRRGLAHRGGADRDDRGTARERADDRGAERRARRPRRAERQHDPRIDVRLRRPEIGVAERLRLAKDGLVRGQRDAVEGDRQSPARCHGRENTGNTGRGKGVAPIGTQFVLTPETEILLR